MNGLQTEELTHLREEVEEFRKQNTLLQTQLGDKDALINTLVSKCEFRPVKYAKSILDMTIGTIEIYCVSRLSSSFVCLLCRGQRRHRRLMAQQEAQKVHKYWR